MNPIDVCEVTKSFDEGKLLILDKVSFSVYEGQSTAIVGKSGAGKSTLLHIAGGLDSPTSGSVLYGGKDITCMGDREKSRIRNSDVAFVFQSNLLLEDFNALENVMMPALLAKKDPAKARQRALELLERFGLKDRAKHFPDQLSGGEKQRVAICRAMMNDPKVVFADEPTGSLDEENAAQTEEILLSIAKEEGRSLLLVTHDNNFAMRCDNVLLLKGRTVTALKGTV